MGPILRNASWIAARQHGTITTAQLLSLGLARSSVKKWHQKGLLHREFRGVWRLGHRAPSHEAHYMAAVLACGEGAALSGLAALFHYGLLRGDPPRPEVTAPKERVVPGINARRRIVPSRIWRDIPTTTVPQTIADVALLLPLDALARICHQAEVTFGVKSAPGCNPKLRAIYSGDHALLLSRLEREFRRLLREHGLPLPQTNRKAGAHFVDCRWPGLTVELDSYRFHHSRHMWEQDRERERAARRRGDEFRRYAWRDVVEEPEAMLTDLVPLLPTTLPSPRRDSSVGRAHD